MPVAFHFTKLHQCIRYCSVCTNSRYVGIEHAVKLVDSTLRCTVNTTSAFHFIFLRHRCARKWLLSSARLWSVRAARAAAARRAARATGPAPRTCTTGSAPRVSSTSARTPPPRPPAMCRHGQWVEPTRSQTKLHSMWVNSFWVKTTKQWRSRYRSVNNIHILSNRLSVVVS